MKKPVNTTKKRSPAKKDTQNTKRKAAQPRKKRASSKAKARRYNALQAFMLVGVLVALSTIISLAVIIVHSSLNQPPADTPQTSVEKPVERKPETETEGNNAGGTAAVENPAQDKGAKPPIETPGTTTAPQAKPQATPSNAAPAAKPANTTKPANVAVKPPANTNVKPVTPPAAAQKPPAKLGNLVFVIDDAGNNLRELEPFLRIPGPLTIAVLPGLPHSAEAARRIRAAGKEVFLHQPMEALGGQNPGPQAIYSGMKSDEIRALLTRNLEEVGPVAGINNHQGSKVTMDRDAVETILKFCAEHGIKFLDSRTTAETIVPAAAAQLGIKIGERNVFLDNEQNKEAMTRYLSDGLQKSANSGSAVMIGHTWSPELAPLLTEQFPLLKAKGYTIKTASDIINSK